MNRERGQAALLILLVMAVVLTVVLSIVASSTSDIRISSNQAESLRAFSAAESGVEQALITSSSSCSGNTCQGTVGNAKYNATVSSLAQGQKFFNYPSNLLNGDLGVLWFVAHGSGGTFVCNSSTPCFTGATVKICWGKPGTANNTAVTPAVDLTVYYLNTPGDYSTVRVSKAIYDPNSGRTSSNSYSVSDIGSCNVGGVNYAFQKIVSLGALGIPGGVSSSQNGLQFLTARMIYNSDQDQPLGFDLNFNNNTTIPSQGRLIDSTGNLNAATRKIEVSSPYTTVPSIFDNALFSTSGITQ